MGPITDGLMATSAIADYPESFAVSAAQDPGARHLGCLALGLLGLRLAGWKWGASTWKLAWAAALRKLHCHLSRAIGPPLAHPCLPLAYLPPQAC